MHALICAHGLSEPSPTLPPADLIIAVDGGAHWCHTLRQQPHILLGDFDSLPEQTLQRWRQQKVAVHRYPADKDQTDLELALHLAVARGAQRITVVGALGGRWDQSIANVLLLAHPRWRGLPVTLVDGRQEVFLVQGQGVVHGAVGDTVSLIAVGGDAQGVTTRGLHYSLEDGVIPFGAALGVSNRLTAAQAEITVRQGLLVVVHIRGRHH